MRAAFLLLAHSLKRGRALIIAAAMLLAGFQFVLILVAASVQRSNAFSQMNALIPAFARELLGPAIGGLMSFQGIVCLGYFHLAVIGALVALCISLSTMPTGEIESGFMDLILSRPLARHWVITRSIALVALTSAGLLAIMMLGTWAGLNAFAPAGSKWPTNKLIGSLAANLLMLMLSWSGISIAIAAASQRRAVASSVAGLLAVGTFLLDYVARAWRSAEPLGYLSPFHYYNPFAMLMGAAVPPKHLLILAGIAIAGYAVSYVLFSRRDISH